MVQDHKVLMVQDHIVLDHKSIPKCPKSSWQFFDVGVGVQIAFVWSISDTRVAQTQSRRALQIATDLLSLGITPGGGALT